MTTHSFVIDAKGRITLPRELREYLGVVPGDEIVGRIDGGELSVSSRQSVQEKLWAMAIQVTPVPVQDSAETAAHEIALLSARERPGSSSGLDCVGEETLKALGLR